jgi:hypothetical protein
MSTLQVTTITTVNNTTPLIMQTGNTGGGQIILQATNNDVQFTGNMRLTANIVGDGSGLTLPTANVANAAYNTANNAYTFGNTVYAAVNSAFAVINAAYTAQNTDYTSSNAAFGVANGAFGKANNALANTSGTFAGTLTVTNNVVASNIGAGFAPTSGRYLVAGADMARGLSVSNDRTTHLRYDNNGLNYIFIENFGITATGQGIGIQFYANSVSTTDTGYVAGSIFSVANGLYTSASTSNSHLAFGTSVQNNNQERMRILDTGNVGIGTTSPNTQFEISKAVANYWSGSTNTFTGRPQALTITNTNGGGYDPVLLFRQADQGALNIKDAGAIGMVGTASWSNTDTTQQTSDMYFLVRNNANGISERMRITSAGNVGIGTTSPGYEAHVYRNKSAAVTNLAIENPNATGGSSLLVTSQGSHTAVFGITDAGGGNRIGTTTNDYVYFVTNGTERMRIDTSGNLLFNSGYGSVQNAYGCRVWVRFAGASASINGSGGMSSVTRNATGNYTLNFGFTLSDTNYISGFGGGSATASTAYVAMEQHDSQLRTTTQLKVYALNGAMSPVDAGICCWSIHR